MEKNSSDGMVTETRNRLKSLKLSYYRIAVLIDEPRSTVFKILKGKHDYSSERINSILTKINNHLNSLEESITDEKTKQDLEPKVKIPTVNDCPEIFENHDLYTKLFELGLNSRSFNPEEKLRFAIWHRTLQNYKKNLEKDSE